MILRTKFVQLIFFITISISYTSNGSLSKVSDNNPVYLNDGISTESSESLPEYKKKELHVENNKISTNKKEFRDQGNSESPNGDANDQTRSVTSGLHIKFPGYSSKLPLLKNQDDFDQVITPQSINTFKTPAPNLQINSEDLEITNSSLSSEDSSNSSSNINDKVMLMKNVSTESDTPQESQIWITSNPRLRQSSKTTDLYKKENYPNLEKNIQYSVAKRNKSQIATTNDFGSAKNLITESLTSTKIPQRETYKNKENKSLEIGQDFQKMNIASIPPDNFGNQSTFLDFNLAKQPATVSDILNLTDQSVTHSYKTEKVSRSVRDGKENLSSIPYDFVSLNTSAETLLISNVSDKKEYNLTYYEINSNQSENISSVFDVKSATTDENGNQSTISYGLTSQKTSSLELLERSEHLNSDNYSIASNNSETYQNSSTDTLGEHQADESVNSTISTNELLEMNEQLNNSTTNNTVPTEDKNYKGNLTIPEKFKASDNSKSSTEEPMQFKTLSVKKEVNQPSNDSKILKVSQRRIEISEKDIVHVYWVCPEKTEEINKPLEQCEWYKMSRIGNYKSPLLKTTDPDFNRSVLEIKVTNTSQEGRYFCLCRTNDPFTSSRIFFYQIIILKSRWINIGSIDAVTLYYHQKAVINCPYGDIIKNNATLNDAGCSCRMTIQEESCHNSKDVFRCSNSNKITIKMPAKDSSTNCSLALLACNNKKPWTSNDENGEKKKEFVNIDRCNFKNENHQFSHLVTKQCSGKVFIRYYFDNFKGGCFPFETKSCSEDHYSFSSLQECEKICVTIPLDLKTCFYPRNEDLADSCPELGFKGRYMATYDIESNRCNWFYHCGIVPLTINVFKSISVCRKTCVKRSSIIKSELIKCCLFRNLTRNLVNSNKSNESKQLWLFNKEALRCELSNVILYKNQFALYFTTKQKCEKMCHVFGSEEICQSRPRNGECSQKVIKWHFDMNSRRCIQILDGGCGDSLNRFNSKLTCEKMCFRFMNGINGNSTLDSVKSTITTLKSKYIYTTTTGSTVNIVTPTIRKRFHREISDQMFNSTTPNVIKSKPVTIQKQFNIFERKLDFEPCFKDALLGTCDYGLGRKDYRMARYSFNYTTGRCYRVLFSGCRGGENLFDDANDCKEACEFRLYQSLKSSRCLNHNLHMCVAPGYKTIEEKSKRYFFFSSTRDCVPLQTISSSFCLEQSFPTIDACRKFCIPNLPVEPILQNRCFGNIVLSESSCLPDERVNLWFFMSNIHQCLQYSSCPVDFEGNVFHTKMECEQACTPSNILAVCGLPMNIGQGNFNKGRYYYDIQIGKCRKFYYKGSLGNLNRFKNRGECERVCTDTMGKTDAIKYSFLTTSLDHEREYNGTSSKVVWLNERTDKEYCFNSHRYGECSMMSQQIYSKRFYYDPLRKQCEPYIFSGCGSISKNSFDSIFICDKMCTERIAKITSSLCSQKVSKCSDSQLIYWSYNSERGVCEPFSSCIKKSNDQFFFTNEQHCSRTCAPSLPYKKDLFDICHLPPSINRSCSITTERWYYEEASQSCYSSFSCEQYGNNFPSMDSCLSACQPTKLLDTCKLPVDKGPCNSNFTKFHFDWESQTCKSFVYGGCLGNRNRFQTLSECHQTCLTKNRCNFQYNNVNCAILNKTPVSNMYYYDKTERVCLKVKHFSCGDHRQFFQSKEECKIQCNIPTEYEDIVFQKLSKPKKIIQSRCGESLKFNNYPLCLKSDEWLPRYFYDKYQDKCIFFYYNGCNGTKDFGNRFTSMLQCKSYCVYTNLTTKIMPRNLSFESTKSPGTTIKSNLIKSGMCPRTSKLCFQMGEILTNCQSDIDCPGILKCCACEISQSIESVCIEPLDCMATEHGCCADGKTLATDSFHQQCKKQKPIIGPDLPEIMVKDIEDDLILKCNVNGDPKPRIIWIYFSNTTQIFQEDSIYDLIRPIWSNEIRIPSTQDSFGLWVCQAENGVGWDEKEIYVHSSNANITFLKSFSPDQRDSVMRNTTLNQNLVLYCPIYGIPRPTITWVFDRIEVKENFKSILVMHTHLIINRVSLLHEGIWICIAKNSVGSISYRIRLNVIEPLKIFPPPMGNRIKANQGQKIILFCNVQAEGEKSINWYLEFDKKIYLLNASKEDPRILKILSFENEYYSTYICEASNRINRETLRYIIVPYNSNDISVNPSGILFVGTPLILECPINHYDKISKIIWKKDQVVQHNESSKLYITLRSTLDSGYYSCQHNGQSYMTYLMVHDKLLGE